MNRKPNRLTSENSFVRAVQWGMVVFGLIVTACGGWISWSDGGNDVGGIVGGFFLFAGLALAIMAMLQPRWWKW